MGNLDLFAPITKSEKLADGSMLVYGKITGPDLDLDGQRCDPVWLAKAVPDWMAVGNLRLMHQPVAIGKALEHEQDGDDHYITAKVVDQAAVKLVDEGVLTGFSVGIKSPKLRKDASAPNGLIVGGKIVETSLVDAPCNESCKLVLAKAVSTTSATLPDLEIEDLQPVDDPVLEKKDFSADERSHLAQTGAALPDGSFPIQNREDLKNAIQAYGRAKDPEAAKKHIIARANALRAADELPSDWIRDHTIKSVDGGDGDGLTPDDDGQSSALDQARTALRQLAAMEAAELGDGSGGTGPVHAVTSMLDQLDWYEELDEADDAAHTTADKVAAALRAAKEPTVATLPDLVKAVTAGDADKDQLDELRKALNPDPVDITAKVAEAVEDALKGVTDRLAKVEEMPAAGGPTRMAPAVRVQETAAHDRRRNELMKLADQVKDQSHAAALRKLAEREADTP